MSRPLLVVVHDVAPPFADEVRSLVERLRPFGVPVVGAVVPEWRGNRCWRGAEDLPELFDEILVHGLTHRRRRGAWRSPVSWATSRSDELGGLSGAGLRARLHEALEATREVADREPAGLLPPAWQLPRAGRELAFEAGYGCVVGFASLDGRAGSVPVDTWSWDWGVGGRPIARLGERLSDLRARSSQRVRCLALHPADVRRGLVDRAMALLERSLASGHRALTTAEVLS